MKIAVSKSTPKAEIADGTHSALCIKVEEKYMEEDMYNNHEKVVLHMQFPDFLDEDGDLAVIEAMVNKKLSEKATLYQYAVALGVKLDGADELDTDDLVGKDCLAVVKNEANSAGVLWPRIKNMIAAPTKGSRGQSMPSIVQPDGDPNWQRFWQVLTEKGIKKPDVAKHLGLDEDMDALGKKLGAMDGADASLLLEELLSK